LLFALFSSRSLISQSLPPASIVPRLRNAIDREVFALLFIFVSLEGLGRDLDGSGCFRLGSWNTSTTLCYALFRTPHPNGRFFSVDPRIGSARKLHLLDLVVLGSRSFSGLNLLRLYELCALRQTQEKLPRSSGHSSASLFFFFLRVRLQRPASEFPRIYRWLESFPGCGSKSQLTKVTIVARQP
jgi:hypothetical protein